MHGGEVVVAAAGDGSGRAAVLDGRRGHAEVHHVAGILENGHHLLPGAAADVGVVDRENAVVHAQTAALCRAI